MSRDQYQIGKETIFRRFPDVILEDETMLAIAETASEFLAEHVPLTQLPNLFGNLEKLPESVLDALAYDLKTDWYNYNYDIATKRAQVRSSPSIHRKLGTPDAVNRALSDVYPGSYIEEWFDYGGLPYHFQVVIETKSAREPANYDDIMQVLRMTKRLTAHLDGIVYQCDMSIVLETEAKGHKGRAHWTGRHECGTIYDRAVKGGIDDTNVRVTTAEEAIETRTALAGTKPYRETKGGAHASRIDIETEETPFEASAHSAGKDITGTVYDRAVKGGIGDTGIHVIPEGTAIGVRSDLSGTKPYRETKGGAHASRIDIEAEETPLEVTVHSAGKDRAGTVYDRTVKGGTEDTDVRIRSAGSAYEAHSDLTGTRPYRETKGGIHSDRVNIRTEGTPLEAAAHSTGKNRAGTVPGRTAAGGTGSGEVSVATETEPFQTTNGAAGTKPRRASLPGLQDTTVQTVTEAKPCQGRSPVSGRREAFRPEEIAPGLADMEATVQTTAKGLDAIARAPDEELPARPRPSGGLALPGGLYAFADAEGFRYRSTWCGRDYCRRPGVHILRR